jgi:hypothetical protein
MQKEREGEGEAYSRHNYRQAGIRCRNEALSGEKLQHEESHNLYHFPDIVRVKKIKAVRWI